MHDKHIDLRRHDHCFGQEKKRPGEARTIIVIVVTATMMVVEIAAGIVFGSMALLADGLHMASHAAALTISAFLVEGYTDLIRLAGPFEDLALELWVLAHTDLRETARVTALMDHIARELRTERALFEGKGKLA